MRFIQGFFCQRVQGLGTGFAAGEGTVVTVQEGAFPFMYGGVIWLPERADPEFGLVGQMRDHWGDAELSGIRITDTVMRFTKCYIKGTQVDRERSIEYCFNKREGNTWVGEYRASGLTGPTRCIITEVDDNLFKGDMARFVESGARKKA